jgi:hypothetical protein
MIQLGRTLIPTCDIYETSFSRFLRFLRKATATISATRRQHDGKARAMKMARLKVIEPNAAPTNIATTAAIHCCQRGLVPRARDESAVRPAMVNGSTVAVRSGTANLRMAALRTPIAMTVKPIIA